MINFDLLTKNFPLIKKKSNNIIGSSATCNATERTVLEIEMEDIGEIIKKIKQVITNVEVKLKEVKLKLHAAKMKLYACISALSGMRS